MNKIKLGRKKLNNLIKLCEEFFPQWIKIEVDEHKLIITGFRSPTPTKEYDEFHWFELSWLLLGKICDKKKFLMSKRIKIIEDFGIVCADKIKQSESLSLEHPIDFLYYINSHANNKK